MRAAQAQDVWPVQLPHEEAKYLRWNGEDACRRPCGTDQRPAGDSRLMLKGLRQLGRGARHQKIDNVWRYMEAHLHRLTLGLTVVVVVGAAGRSRQMGSGVGCVTCTDRT